eukprot:COSAG06_NODE_38092_length_427_cov_1.250000_1_plen_81_part_00
MPERPKRDCDPDGIEPGQLGYGLHLSSKQLATAKEKKKGEEAAKKKGKDAERKRQKQAGGRGAVWILHGPGFKTEVYFDA